jgi:putative DNA primase/helicase
VWRRIRLIPFAVTIPEADQDPDLSDKLRAEFPGILRWAVEGCSAWQRDGLGTPDVVREATAEYRASQDVIGSFLAESCVTYPQASVGATVLFNAYKTWCDESKESPEKQRSFGDALTERGFRVERHRITGKKIRVGLRLLSEQSEQSEQLFSKV